MTSSDDLGAMAAAGLLEPHEYMHLVKPPRVKRKPSLIRAIRTARKAGVATGTVTVGEISVSFGESDPTNTSGNAFDEWKAKHAH